MNPSEIKKKYAALWKDTFHDSDEYVSMVFDTYFDPEFVAYEEADGQLVAALMGVPYRFGNTENNLRGLYLCGLATKPQYRSRGIMTRLLATINEKAREAGFAFTFLIPADAGLCKYYHDREYVNAFYRVVDNYTNLHDFDKEYESVLAEQKEKVATLKRNYFQSLQTGVITRDSKDREEAAEGVGKLISELESSQLDLQILHSEKDIRTLIKENGLDRGAIYYVANSSGKVTAAAFTTISGSNSTINIHKLFSADLGSRFKVLGAVKKGNPELGISHFVSSIEMDRKALWQRTYGSFLPDARQVDAISVAERVYSLAAHAKVYGMARILNLSEILKFQADSRHDLKYSILVKLPDLYTLERIDVKNGKVTVTELDADSVAPSELAYAMTRRDVAEVIFRRRDTDNLITEAFGMPSINAGISLMLD